MWISNNSSNSALSALFISCFIPITGFSATEHTRCQTNGLAPQVTLSINQGKVRFYNDYNRGQLKALSRRSSSISTLSKLWQPAGLTLTERQFSMRIEVRAQKLRNSRYCVRLSHVRARIGYDKLRVYIARKYRPKSCQYRSILDHENRHVAIFRAALNQYAPQLKRRLKWSAIKMHAMITQTPEQAARLFQDKMQQQLKPVFREMDKKIKLQNEELDTPENYRREQTRCSRW